MKWMEIDGKSGLLTVSNSTLITNIIGSKIVPVWSWLQMGRDLFLIWLRYSTGAWKIRINSKSE